MGSGCDEETPFVNVFWLQFIHSGTPIRDHHDFQVNSFSYTDIHDCFARFLGNRHEFTQIKKFHERPHSLNPQIPARALRTKSEILYVKPRFYTIQALSTSLLFQWINSPLHFFLASISTFHTPILTSKRSPTFHIYPSITTHLFPLFVDPNEPDHAPSQTHKIYNKFRR